MKHEKIIEVVKKESKVMKYECDLCKKVYESDKPMREIPEGWFKLEADSYEYPECHIDDEYHLCSMRCLLMKMRDEAKDHLTFKTFSMSINEINTKLWTEYFERVDWLERVTNPNVINKVEYTIYPDGEDYTGVFEEINRIVYDVMFNKKDAKQVNIKIEALDDVQAYEA